MENSSVINKVSPRTIKIIVWICCVMFICLVIAGIVQFIYLKTYSAIINTIYTPMDATVMINGQASTQGEHRLKPGKYTVEVLMDGFDSQKRDIEIASEESKTEYFILEPNDSSTMNWYEEHIEDGIRREEISGELLTSSSENIQETYPAVSFLPYDTSAYSIGYGVCDLDVNKVCMKVSAQRSSGAWSVALKRFTQLDKDLGKYNFEFLNYVNPFEVINVASSLGDVENALPEMLSCSGGKYTIKAIDEIDTYSVAYLNYSGNDYPAGSDLYKVVLENNGDGLKIVIGPTLVINYDDYSEIPKELIERVNAVF